MNVLPFDKQVAIISALTEGCSIRTTERLTGVHRDTIMRLAARVGFGAIEPSSDSAALPVELTRTRREHIMNL
jgi:hypothetical protein